MSEKVVENNKATVIGTIASGFAFSHEAFGEGFYVVDLEVGRLSGKSDMVPLMISERLLDVEEDYRGRTVEAAGQFRSYDLHEETRNRLILSVFVREIRFLEEDADCTGNNRIFLEGHLCKAPFYRETPLGREIADMLLAVNRPYGKSDYIPCIAWGRNARCAASLRTGGRVRIRGRIQSREYEKTLCDGGREKRIAYEVSVSRMTVQKDDEDGTENPGPSEKGGGDLAGDRVYKPRVK